VAPPVRPGDSTGVRQPGGRRPQPETDNGIRMARENLRSYRNGGLTADAREIRLTELRRSLAERRQEGTATASFRGRPGMRDSEGRPMPVSRPDAGSPRTYSNPAGSHTTYTATEQQRPTQSETRASGGETRNSPPEVRPATP
jgi:hypothetical protein